MSGQRRPGSPWRVAGMAGLLFLVLQVAVRVATGESVTDALLLGLIAGGTAGVVFGGWAWWVQRSRQG